MECYDCILVLGYPNMTAMQHRILNSRLKTALQIYRRGASGVIIVTGGGTRVRPAGTEADVMKAYLIGRGVPPSAIIAERRSKNTIGNAFFSKPLIQKNSRFAVVTSEFHVPRARYIFGKFFGRGYRIKFVASKTDARILGKAVAFERESLKHVRSVLRGINARSGSPEVRKVLGRIRKHPMTPEMKKKAWY